MLGNDRVLDLVFVALASGVLTVIACLPIAIPLAIIVWWLS